MSNPTAIRYIAFLSYSSRDETAAKRLHRELENHPIDRELVGRDSPIGQIPKRLRPIFRDRDNFAAGQDLSVSLNQLGAAQLDGGDIAGARRTFEEDLTLTRELAAKDPANAKYAEELLVSLVRAARLHALPPPDPDRLCRQLTEIDALVQRGVSPPAAAAALITALKVALTSVGRATGQCP